MARIHRSAQARSPTGENRAMHSLIQSTGWWTTSVMSVYRYPSTLKIQAQHQEKRLRNETFSRRPLHTRSLQGEARGQPQDNFGNVFRRTGVSDHARRTVSLTARPWRPHAHGAAWHKSLRTFCRDRPATEIPQKVSRSRSQNRAHCQSYGSATSASTHGLYMRAKSKTGPLRSQDSNSFDG